MDLDDIALMLSIKKSIGSALSRDDQLFVSEHYKKINDFLISEVGKSAINDFVGLWKLSKV